MGTLLDLKDEILRGVDLDAWRPTFDEAMFDSALAAIGNSGERIVTDRGVTPPPKLILEALRYGAPQDFHTVIVGQDPYPTPGNAQGLCFSVPNGTPLPESLKRVFGCLDRAGLRRDWGADSDRGDLRPWAVQGVLMLNAALTTRGGETRAHTGIWADFVQTLVGRLCALRSAGELHFLLWGGDARRHAAVARQHGHHVHEWSHPSPMADNKLPPALQFRSCGHFEEVNAALLGAGRRVVNWDTQMPVVAFTDGSCPRNGKPGARAGFAVAIIGGQFGGWGVADGIKTRAALVYGEVAPHEYEFVDADDPERGVRPARLVFGGADKGIPSNNRGELMGLVYCFLALLRGRALGQVEVVSDSQISIKTLLEWLPNRLKKGTERGLENYDLIALAWELLGRLRDQAASVTLTHVNSHQSSPPTSATSRERLLWLGNDIVDKYACAPLASSTADYSVHVLNAPPVLHRL